jgi:nucleoside-triphosphatase THEP1
MSSQPAPLGAIVYGAEQAAADAVLTSVARVLAGLGTRLAGAVQHNPSRPDRCRCDMVLEDLATGEIIAISEDRGPEARGCRLNPAALEQLVGAAAASLERGADLLIVNRFGKREAEGRGFRAIIETAVTSGVPVLRRGRRRQSGFLECVRRRTRRAAGAGSGLRDPMVPQSAAAELGGLGAARAGRPRVTGAGSRFSKFECALLHQITPAVPGFPPKHGSGLTHVKARLAPLGHCSTTANSDRRTG